MAKKSLFYFILFLLLLSGNIYFACRYFVSARTEFQVEGDKNDFLCRRGSNAASVIVDNNNIIAVGAAASNSDFYWAAIGNLFMLNYNNCMVIDYNRDFIADYISMPKEKKYIQINGKLILIEKIDLINKIATFPDGKMMVWKNNRWQ